MVIDFFKVSAHDPIFTKEQINHVTMITELTEKNKINILQEQEDFKRKYQLFKKYNFNSFNFFHVSVKNSVDNRAGIF